MPFDATAMTRPSEAETNKSTDTDPNLLPIYAALVLFLVVMVTSAALFGLPGLYLPVVSLVPVMFVLLIRISLG